MPNFTSPSSNFLQFCSSIDPTVLDLSLPDLDYKQQQPLLYFQQQQQQQIHPHPYHELQQYQQQQEQQPHYLSTFAFEDKSFYPLPTPITIPEPAPLDPPVFEFAYPPSFAAHFVPFSFDPTSPLEPTSPESMMYPYPSPRQLNEQGLDEYDLFDASAAPLFQDQTLLQSSAGGMAHGMVSVTRAGYASNGVYAAVTAADPACQPIHLQQDQQPGFQPSYTFSALSQDGVYPFQDYQQASEPDLVFQSQSNLTQDCEQQHQSQGLDHSPPHLQSASATPSLYDYVLSDAVNPGASLFPSNATGSILASDGSDLTMDMYNNSNNNNNNNHSSSSHNRQPSFLDLATDIQLESLMTGNSFDQTAMPNADTSNGNSDSNYSNNGNHHRTHQSMDRIMNDFGSLAFYPPGSSYLGSNNEHEPAPTMSADLVAHGLGGSQGLIASAHNLLISPASAAYLGEGLESPLVEDDDDDSSDAPASVKSYNTGSYNSNCSLMKRRKRKVNVKSRSYMGFARQRAGATFPASHPATHYSFHHDSMNHPHHHQHHQHQHHHQQQQQQQQQQQLQFEQHQNAVSNNNNNNNNAYNNSSASMSPPATATNTPTVPASPNTFPSIPLTTYPAVAMTPSYPTKSKHAPCMNGTPTTTTTINPDGTTTTTIVPPPQTFHCQSPGCGKVFSRAYNLTSHLKTHSSDRPFRCNHCPLAFARRHDRERHGRLHSGQKPYVCTACQAGFMRNDALHRHQRLCTPLSPLG